ncbi:MAG: hypothetical protein WCS37_07925 [Chloroflexota bacterium]|nr:hypothetical protein [Chloroflexota bacterium]
MALRKNELLELYPEEYLVEEDNDAKSYAQFQLIHNLCNALERYYRVPNWLVTGNVELHHPAISDLPYKITADLVVFKDIEISAEERAVLDGWDIDKKHPAPPIVFESCCPSNWPHENDIEDEQRKIEIYGQIGVREYFSYDPHPTAIRRNKAERRLLGWRYDPNNPAVPQPILPDEQGRLWSEVLESWLVADGSYLRLYDQEDHLRLTGSEAEGIAREMEQIERMALESALEEEQAAREAAERRLVELELLLRKLQGKEDS